MNNINFSWKDICDDSILLKFFESLFDPVAVINANGVFLYVNPAYERELGVSSVKILGKNIRDVAPESTILKVLDSGDSIIEQTSTIKALGLDIIVSSIPLYKKGILMGAVSIFKNVSGIRKLTDELERLKNASEYLSERTVSKDFSDIIGTSENMRKSLLKAMKASKTDITVLLQGETGTGKDLFAKAIHNASNRRNGPLVCINCAALPENLLETELFGFNDGAFTGARKGGKPGKFELANGGTLFLDEIGDMNLSLQAKILRVLQTKVVDRIGATKSIHIDVRIIAATNQDLQSLINQGRFRSDLYYRLNVFNIRISPLRERKCDIPALSSYFLNKYSEESCKLTMSAMNILVNYTWPGNVRQLQNVIESTVASCDRKYITPADFPEYLKTSIFSDTDTDVSDTDDNELNLNKRVDHLERMLLLKALDATRGNRSEAIELLGISRGCFYKKIAKHGIVTK